MANNDPNAPATKRQTWALFCATKKDYRDAGLTYQQASDMLSELNKDRQPVAKKSTKSLEERLLDYLKDNSERVFKIFMDALGMQSVVQVDTSILPDDGKRYLFFGFGCGFAWLKYDKRSGMAKLVDSAFSKVRWQFQEWFIDKYFSKEVQATMNKLGSPLQAIMAQDIGINQRIIDIVVDFARNECKVKNIYSMSRLD